MSSLACASPDWILVLHNFQERAAFVPPPKPFMEPNGHLPTPGQSLRLVCAVVGAVLSLSTLGDHSEGISALADPGRERTSRALPNWAARANSLNVTTSLLAANLQRSAS